MNSIVHIVNPVKMPETSDLYIAQPITFESMRVAKQMAEGRVRVRQIATHYPEDQAVVPAEFGSAGLLERSVLDLGTFSEQRKLPLLRDILDRLYESSEGTDYLIYTNVDIALMPSFYLTVNGLIEQGYDAFVINRRTIPDHFRDPADLALMYAEIGSTHPGYDCFVFRRDAYPSYDVGRFCIGAPVVGKALLLNLVAYSHRFEEFKAIHATFHIGDDETWRRTRFADQARWNRAEAEALADRLEPQIHTFENGAILAGYIEDLRKRLKMHIRRGSETQGPTTTGRIQGFPRRARRAWRILRGR